MKLTAVTTNNSTSLNLNSLYDRVQMNTKDLLGIAIVKRMKLQDNAGMQIRTLSEIRRKFLIGKAG